ncbi:MAG: ATP-dependent DNA helicase RecG [Oscillospiraceae bacterium]|nr:ATP-dependent DNA helicase RecG [Oscillospiraceae bacterium]
MKPSFRFFYDSPLTSVNGIGKVKAEHYLKLGVTNVSELLFLFPRSYRINRIINLAEAPEGKTCVFCLTVASRPSLFKMKSGLKAVRFSVFDDSSRAVITYFNNPYIKNSFSVGDKRYFTGAIKKLNGVRYLSSPLSEKEFNPSLPYRPVYPCVEGISSRETEKFIGLVLGETDSVISETLSAEQLSRLGFMGRADAVRAVHRPQSETELKSALNRLAFDEFYDFALKMQKSGTERTAATAIPMNPVSLDGFFSALGFALTSAQNRVISEIRSDICRNPSSDKHIKPMNRLLQGDVGSGKTAVAFCAAFTVLKNGYNVMLMAPTEILASQHYEKASALFSKMSEPGFECILITGSTPASARKRFLSQAASGQRFFVFGTHALISDWVNISDVGLVITDEQHRFGVRQRDMLAEKSGGGHILLMSATPIPRTLAMFLYADRDISVIDELPPGRRRVRTFLCGDDMRKRIDALIIKEATSGHRTYIVCPAIEPDDEDTGAELCDAVSRRDQAANALPGLRIGLMHGKMKPSEKDGIMREFTCGELDVLVSTTVIEVGVDVPEATVMIVENAERFGLAQLHQLRGRVGRGSAESFMIMFSSHSSGQSESERLNKLCEEYDGFKLAEFDLASRGPGDFFGTRQSGQPVFALAGLADAGVMAMAKAEAERMVNIPENEEIH